MSAMRGSAHARRAARLLACWGGLACVSLLSFPTFLSAEAPPWLTPEAAIARAGRRWPEVDAAVEALRAAEARLGEARWSPWLQARVQGGLAVAPEQRGTVWSSPDSQLPLSNPWRPVASVSLRGTVPLYTFGKLSAAREAAEAGVAAERARGLAVRRRLRHRVLQAYFGLQLALDAGSLLGEAEGWLRRARRRLQRLLASEEAEEAAPGDEHRLAVASAALRARRASVRRLEQVARDGLSVLLDVEGATLRIPDCPAEPVSLPRRSVSAWQRLAEASRPELEAVRAAVAARGAALRGARAAWWPDLALGYQAGVSWAPGITDQRNPFVRDPANYQDLSAALVLRWSLDPLGNLYRGRRAEALLGRDRARFEALRRAVRLEVAEAWGAYREAAEREAAWREGARQGRAWAVGALQGYEVGAGNVKELVESLRAYLEARWSLLQAVHDRNVAASRLWNAVGAPGAPPGGWQPPCPPAEE